MARWFGRARKRSESASLSSLLHLFQVVESWGPPSWARSGRSPAGGVPSHAAAILSLRHARVRTRQPRTLLGAVRTQVQQLDKSRVHQWPDRAADFGARAMGRAHGRGLARPVRWRSLDPRVDWNLWRAGVFRGAEDE